MNVDTQRNRIFKCLFSLDNKNQGGEIAEYKLHLNSNYENDRYESHCCHQLIPEHLFILKLGP